MNPIGFTKEHEDKLLEICRNLFPEYEHIQVRNYYSMSDYAFQPIKPDGRDNDGLFAIEFLTKKEYEHSKDDFNGIGYSISVFEFCMTKLWIKMNSLLNHKNPEELMSMYNAFWDISNEKLHPIDYFYEQFKQLK